MRDAISMPVSSRSLAQGSSCSDPRTPPPSLLAPSVTASGAAVTAATLSHTHTLTLSLSQYPLNYLKAAVKERLLLSASTAYRGYQPLGTNVTRHEAGFTQDWHEALDFYRCVCNVGGDGGGGGGR